MTTDEYNKDPLNKFNGLNKNDPTVYQVRAARKGFDNEIDIAIMGVRPDCVSVCADLGMKLVKDGEEVKPVLTIPFEAAVDLMTDLWNAGIRPEGVDLADSKTLLAVQAHLNDSRMYAVAFWNKMTGGQPAPAPVLDKDGKIIEFPGPEERQRRKEKDNPNEPDGEGQDKQ